MRKETLFTIKVRQYIFLLIIESFEVMICSLMIVLFQAVIWLDCIKGGSKKWQTLLSYITDVVDCMSVSCTCLSKYLVK